MGSINTQPWTAYTGPYGGSGYTTGAAAINSAGTAGAKGGAITGNTANGGHIDAHGAAGFVPGGAAASGAAAYTAPDGSTYYAGGKAFANAEGAVGWGSASVNNANVFGTASGSFSTNNATGEVDASGSADWCNKNTGEYHSASATADLVKGQGGTVTTVKDGAQKTYNIPPRPTA
ncbi:MAG: hypothetical protein AB2L14_28835 [Candidatus Xenobiia bacterium LiM19]